MASRHLFGLFVYKYTKNILSFSCAVDDCKVEFAKSAGVRAVTVHTAVIFQAKHLAVSQKTTNFVP